VGHIFIPLLQKRELCIWSLRIPCPLSDKTSVTLSTDWDVEASLAVDESRDPVTQVMRDPIKPVRGTGPFLLIVRTGRIFTAHATTETNRCDRTSTAGYSEFPAFSRVCFKGLLP
jgi:hypothetical protein